ncbi:protein phosphatase 2C domain-containing protein [Melittangium boletus]|nr:protein phosphatase 2C domain-containing protein [Archangium primigenium]
MNTDHFFTTGQLHVSRGEPCEDYALSGAFDTDTVYGAVSDGCSGMEAHTDVGARAICFAFQKALRPRSREPLQAFGPAFFPALKGEFQANHISSDRQDYFASLVGFVANPREAAIYLFGSGAYVLRYADGRHKVVWFEWDGNAPFYLNYCLHEDLYREYVGDIQKGIDDPAHEHFIVFRVAEDGRIRVLESGSLRHEFDSLEQGHVACFRPVDEGIEAMAVITDGIFKMGQVQAPEVVRELLTFEERRGGFVKRRLTQVLEAFAQQGSLPRDDLGIACVWFGAE